MRSFLDEVVDGDLHDPRMIQRRGGRSRANSTAARDAAVFVGDLGEARCYR
jgi:hypothetical protein